jgi:hypothetical protein
VRWVERTMLFLGAKIRAPPWHNFTCLKKKKRKKEKKKRKKEKKKKEKKKRKKEKRKKEKKKKKRIQDQYEASAQ